MASPASRFRSTPYAKASCSTARAGSPCPTERPVQVILGAANPDQQTVEFVVGRIETDAVSMTEVTYDEGMAAFVARADRGVEQVIPLKGLGPDPTLVTLSPPGQPGQDRLRAEFAIDDQQRLRLTVLDRETGKRLLHDEVVAGLDTDAAGRADKGPITGREPHLSRAHLPGRRQLSLRRLATALNLMPPESVSLQVIQKALHSADMTARYSAAEMLGRRGDRDARRLVEEVLAHEPPPLRASVARHLHRFAWFGARPVRRLSRGVLGEDRGGQGQPKQGKDRNTEHDGAERTQRSRG